MVYFLITSVIYLFLQASYIRKIQEIPIVWRLKEVFSFLATINSLMIYILVLFLDCVAVSCFILFLFPSLEKKESILFITWCGGQIWKDLMQHQKTRRKDTWRIKLY